MFIQKIILNSYLIIEKISPIKSKKIKYAYDFYNTKKNKNIKTNFKRIQLFDDSKRYTGETFLIPISYAEGKEIQKKYAERGFKEYNNDNHSYTSELRTKTLIPFGIGFTSPQPKGEKLKTNKSLQFSTIKSNIIFMNHGITFIHILIFSKGIHHFKLKIKNNKTNKIRRANLNIFSRNFGSLELKHEQKELRDEITRHFIKNKQEAIGHCKNFLSNIGLLSIDFEKSTSMSNFESKPHPNNITNKDIETYICHKTTFPFLIDEYNETALIEHEGMLISIENNNKNYNKLSLQIDYFLNTPAVYLLIKNCSIDLRQLNIETHNQLIKKHSNVERNIKATESLLDKSKKLKNKNEAIQKILNIDFPEKPKIINLFKSEMEKIKNDSNILFNSIEDLYKSAIVKIEVKNIHFQKRISWLVVGLALVQILIAFIKK